ncbi:hypothetical protein FQN60_014370, partial [Etheostoma spectabile]
GTSLLLPFNISGNGGRRRVIVEGGGRRGAEDLKNPSCIGTSMEVLFGMKSAGVVVVMLCLRQRPSLLLRIVLHPRPAELAAAGGEDAGGPTRRRTSRARSSQEEDDAPTHTHHGRSSTATGQGFGIGARSPSCASLATSFGPPHEWPCSLEVSGQHPMCRLASTQQMDSCRSFSPAAPASPPSCSRLLCQHPPPPPPPPPCSILTSSLSLLTTSSSPALLRPSSHCTHSWAPPAAMYCVNTPGSFHCFRLRPGSATTSPGTAAAAQISTSVKTDAQLHSGPVCDTYGGFQCAALDCLTWRTPRTSERHQ